MPDLAAPAPVFRLADAPAEHRAFLLDARESIRSLLARTAANLLRVGQLLAEARARVGHGTFQAWADAEFPWSLSTSHRLIAIARVFADPGRSRQIDAFDPCALYAFSSATCPPPAREHALQLAADGVRITHRVAKQILRAHRPEPLPTPREAREILAASPIKAPPPSVLAALRPETPDEAAWRALAAMVDAGAMVKAARIEEEGTDCEDSQPLYSVTVLRAPEDGGPSNHVRRTLGQAVLAAAGREPRKACPGCKADKPVGMFGASRRNADRLNTYCKACERPRIRAAKKAARARKAV